VKESFMRRRSQHACTRRDFCGGLALASLALAGRAAAVPAPRPAGGGLIAVLDDCDPDYSGKAVYNDNLSLFDTTGKLLARVSGLNICEEIGSPHRIAIDLPARRLWVSETVGHRLLQYDLAGKLLLSVPGVSASALAVDPATHNVWVARSPGRIDRGHTEVYSPAGRLLARHDPRGFDLVHDPKGKAFWLVAQDLVKVSPGGKVLVEVKGVADWCAVSLAVNPRSGAVWAASRKYPPGRGRDALLGFDNAGKRLADVDLESAPFRLALNPADGSVWVTLIARGLRRYSARGRLEAKVDLPVLTAEVDPRTGNVWAVTAAEVRLLARNGRLLKSFPHKARTSQAWIASA
jgi:hypothetical protein